MCSLTYSSACAFELPLDHPSAQIPPPLVVDIPFHQSHPLDCQVLAVTQNPTPAMTLNASWNTYVFPPMNSYFVHWLPLASESMQEQLPTTVSQHSKHGILPITWSGKAVPASGMSLTAFTTVHLGGQAARPILLLTQGCSGNSLKVSISIYPWMLQLQLVQ